MDKKYQKSLPDPSYYNIYNWSSLNEQMTNPIKPEVKPIVKIKINIDVSVNSIEDLLSIVNNHQYDETSEYNIDLKALHCIKEELTQLNNMVGMTSLKGSILDQLLYFIQELHINPKKPTPTVFERLSKELEHKRDQDFCKLEGCLCKQEESEINDMPVLSSSSDFKHTVLLGPPGTGKTEVAKIIGNMYSKIGVLKKNTFKKVTRNDLVAGYLGQTAIKTKAVINSCLGGVLFIDEAYSLANNHDIDSFSKECIDTLCESLSDHKDDLMVIIAGYEDELNNTFFQVNKGLDSRFIWRFKIDKYSASELMAIFKKKIVEAMWSIDDDNTDMTKWFEKNYKDFQNYGRDMELLFIYVKMMHSRRIYGKPVEMRKNINLEDLNRGYDLFIKNKKQVKRSKALDGMYC
jgi:chromosomal replication initiation ATPase DnaA